VDTAPLGSGTRRVAATMARMAALILRFGDGDDAFDKGLDVGEVADAYAWVRRPSAMVRLTSSAPQVTMEPVRKLSAVSPASSGSTPNTLRPGKELLDGCGDSAEKAAAGDGGEDEVDFGEFRRFRGRRWPGRR
jgi:hypothetical protein